MLDDYVDSFIDNVRAALGVDDIELSEDVLDAVIYEMRLEESLNEIHEELLDDFTTLKASTERTSAEDLVVQRVQIFSVYSVASMLCDSLPIFSPKTIGDGKALKTRFSNAPYLETIKRISAVHDSFKNKMTEAYNAYKGTSILVGDTPVPIGNAVPDADPVLNT